MSEKIQQYKILNPEPVLLGGFIYMSNSSEVVCGFISEVTETYMQVTLFEPTPIEDFKFPIFDIRQSVEWIEVFENIADQMNPDLLHLWKLAVSQQNQ